MTVQAHASAILALLGGPSKPATISVLDGTVPQGTLPPYVLVYFAHADPEEADSRPLSGASTRHVVRAYCHCVGTTQASARAVAAWVRTALLDVVPTIAGRECQPIRHEESQPARRDETTGTVVQDLVAVYRLESLPA